MRTSQHKYTGVWNELLFVSVPVFFFAVGGVWSLCRRGEMPSPKDLLVFAVLCAGILANICAAVAAARKNRRAAQPAGCRDRQGLPVLLAAALVLRLPQLGSMPRNDGAFYYAWLCKACRDFDLALGYWLDHFALADHPTYGLVSLAALPEFFFPGNLGNIWLFQTALSLGAVYCLYDILERELGAKRACWGALLVSCAPMFVGLDSYFQTDFGLAVFFFYVMWAFYRKKYVLLAWSSLLLVWTKEFGVVLLVGFFLSMFLYSFAARYTGGFRQRLHRAVHDARLVWLCLLCLVNGLSILYFMSQTSWLNRGKNGAGQSIWSHIGWDLGYTGYKLVEWLSVNFVWLAAVPLLWLAVRALRADAGKKAGTPHLPAELRLLAVGSAGGGILYFLFSCITITATLPRYNLVLEVLAFFWAFLAVVVLGWPDKRLFRPLAAAFCALLAVQAYWTVDPVMHALYARVETGGIPMVDLNAKDVAWFNRGDWYAPPGWLGDHCMYNAQYRYLDICLREMLTAENYDENVDIVRVGSEQGIQLGGGAESDGYYWDREKKRFTFMPGENALPLQALELSADSDQLQQKYAEGTLRKRAIIVLPPSIFGAAAIQQEFEKNLPAFYTNVQRREIRHLPAGVLTYYTADLLPPGA